MNFGAYFLGDSPSACILRRVPTQNYPFERGGLARLSVARAWGFGDAVAHLDGRHVATIERAELATGAFVDLRDGSTIYLRSVRPHSSPAALEVTRNGRPLPGSATDPETRVDLAMAILLMIAAFNTLSGLAAWQFQVSFLVDRGVGVADLLIGLLYGALAVGVKLARSRIAVGIAIALGAADAIFLLAS
ncbi:hypothetical protein L6R52_13255 [Myxococcota bacterium]|nr:hypothetical protein [Myxococcota bacterium]